MDKISFYRYKSTALMRKRCFSGWLVASFFLVTLLCATMAISVIMFTSQAQAGSLSDILFSSRANAPAKTTTQELIKLYLKALRQEDRLQVLRDVHRQWLDLRTTMERKLKNGIGSFAKKETDLAILRTRITRLDNQVAEARQEFSKSLSRIERRTGHLPLPLEHPRINTKAIPEDLDLAITLAAQPIGGQTPQPVSGLTLETEIIEGWNLFQKTAQFQRNSLKELESTIDARNGALEAFKADKINLNPYLISETKLLDARLDNLSAHYDHVYALLNIQNIVGLLKHTIGADSSKQQTIAQKQARTIGQSQLSGAPPAALLAQNTLQGGSQLQNQPAPANQPSLLAENQQTTPQIAKDISKTQNVDQNSFNYSAPQYIYSNVEPKLVQPGSKTLAQKQALAQQTQTVVGLSDNATEWAKEGITSYRQKDTPTAFDKTIGAALFPVTVVPNYLVSLRPEGPPTQTPDGRLYKKDQHRQASDSYSPEQYLVAKVTTPACIEKPLFFDLNTSVCSSSDSAPPQTDFDEKRTEEKRLQQKAIDVLNNNEENPTITKSLTSKAARIEDDTNAQDITQLLRRDTDQFNTPDYEVGLDNNGPLNSVTLRQARKAAEQKRKILRQRLLENRQEELNSSPDPFDQNKDGDLSIEDNNDLNSFLFDPENDPNSDSYINPEQLGNLYEGKYNSRIELSEGSVFEKKDAIQKIDAEAVNLALTKDLENQEVQETQEIISGIDSIDLALHQLDNLERLLNEEKNILVQNEIAQINTDADIFNSLDETPDKEQTLAEIDFDDIEGFSRIKPFGVINSASNGLRNQ